jgi:tRNA(Arg) A34 adenosine deaminase TadA
LLDLRERVNDCEKQDLARQGDICELEQAAVTASKAAVAEALSPSSSVECADCHATCSVHVCPQCLGDLCLARLEETQAAARSDFADDFQQIKTQVDKCEAGAFLPACDARRPDAVLPTARVTRCMIMSAAVSRTEI